MRYFDFYLPYEKLRYGAGQFPPGGSTKRMRLGRIYLKFGAFAPMNVTQ